MGSFYIMALSIKNPRAEKLAAEVAEQTGQTRTRTVIVALEEKLERLRGQRTSPDTLKVIMEISQRCARLDDLDQRAPDEILGYDDRGGFGESEPGLSTLRSREAPRPPQPRRLL